jgi:serine/arginine repetitive matrix protein 2
MLDLVNETSSSSNNVKKSSSKHNYSFPPPLPHDINHLPTPTYDSLTNYSSSPYDCSSTPLSPTDDVGFDRWSTCSEESQLPPHPMGSLSLSRLSRSIHTSQALLDEPESPESVVDRIRRKSFYSRFNEKKPKRVSTIVGPAAKDYYRERSRPLEYTKSATSIIPDLSERCSSERREIPTSSSHVRSLSSTRHASPANASSTANHTRSLSQTRKYSLTDKPLTESTSSHQYMASLPPPYHHHHHHHELNEDYTSRIRSKRSTMYDSSSSSSNNTPTSLSSLYQRRSYVSTPSSSSGTTTTISSSAAMKPPLSFVDGYATIGRKMRQYNTRSVSLLDPSLINATSSNNYANDHHHRVNGYGDSNESSSRYVSLILSILFVDILLLFFF